jgi:hypothetical protein
MFDAIFNKTPEAAALGTFTVTNGNVTKGGNPLVTWFNDKSVIIAMNARVSFTLPAEHQMFDSILMDLMAKNIGVMYVDSVSGFMNPKARFNEFLDGKLDPKSVGMDLPAPLNNLPELYQTVKGLFDAMFTAPVPPMSPGVDLSLYFDADQIVEIEKWRNHDAQHLSSTIRRVINNTGQDKAGLLKVVTSGGSTWVVNDQGHRITKTRFITAYEAWAKRNWEVSSDVPNDRRLNGSYNDVEVKESGSNYNNSKTVAVYRDYVTVGCQSIPRAEVEAMVQKLTAL